MNRDLKSIAMRVQEFKDSMGWSDAEFARKTGIHATAVNQYLAGIFSPLKLLPVLAEYGADVTYIVTGRADNTVQAEESRMLAVLYAAGINNINDVRRVIYKADKLDRLSEPKSLVSITRRVVDLVTEEVEKRIREVP